MAAPATRSASLGELSAGLPGRLGLPPPVPTARSDHRPRLRQPRRRAGEPVLLRHGVPRRRARVRAVGRPCRRRGARRRAPARPRRARADGRIRRGARWRRSPPGSSASRRASCGSSASPARTARPPAPIWCRRCWRQAGRACGLLGTVKSVIGGVERRGAAHHPRGHRSPGRPARDARRGRSGLRDGGLLARARARTRRRDPASPPRCSPTSHRTTSTSTRRWRTTSSPSAACSCPITASRRS